MFVSISNRFPWYNEYKGLICVFHRERGAGMQIWEGARLAFGERDVG